MLISFPIKSLKFPLLRFFGSQKYVPPATLIKKLREDTSSPINECKLALELHSGDIEKAKEHLKAKGLAQAQKRLSKSAHEGLIGVSLSNDRQFSVIAEVNCETDFVARTDLFKNFIARLLETVVQKKISLGFDDLSDEGKTQEGISAFLGSCQLDQDKKPLFPEDFSSKNLSILDTQKLLISKLQENVRIRRILSFTQKNPGLIGSYVHNCQLENIGTSGCFLSLDADLSGKEKERVLITEIADNLAMQILGTKPRFLQRNNIPEAVLNEEKEKIKKDMEKALKGKTPEVVSHIVEGKLKKFYEENVLVDMEFILQEDDGIKVGKYLEDTKKKTAIDFSINKYHLWSLK